MQRLSSIVRHFPILQQTASMSSSNSIVSSGYPRHVFVAVIGATGGVSGHFFRQLEALSHRYLSLPRSPIRLSLIYVARSKTSVLAEYHDPITFSHWSDALAQSTKAPLPPQSLADYLAKAPGRAVVVDNTSNQEVAESYPLFLKKGVSVITPNKKAFSSDLALWEEIFSSAANGTGPEGAGYIFHESTVGAGLPVINTLKDLLETGDIVTKIEGVFSGTMSFLFNSFMPVGGGGAKFSAEVTKAKDLGYTEPDPRDDLNGLDVARKLTILARLCGVKVAGPTSFPVQSLIPGELETCKSGDEFMSRLHEFDGRIEEVKNEAEEEGKVVRYVGSVDVHTGAAEVGLQKFDTSHPIAALKGSDNIINFYTHRYGKNPLTIIGAGAGGDITAMGITADLIRVLNHLY